MESLAAVTLDELRERVESALAGMTLLDSKGKFVAVSRSFAELVGFDTPAQLRGFTAWEFVLAQDGNVRADDGEDGFVVLRGLDGKVHQYVYHVEVVVIDGEEYRLADGYPLDNAFGEGTRFSRTQAALYANRAVKTIDRWREQGLDSYRNTTGRVWIFKRDLDDWLGRLIVVLITFALAGALLGCGFDDCLPLRTFGIHVHQHRL